MPWGDGLGPWWAGYGRGAWGFGRGYGRGFGRGYGWGCYAGWYGAPYPSVEDEKAYLEYQKHFLEEDLKYINERLGLLANKEQ